jgi:hypothetical protein
MTYSPLMVKSDVEAMVMKERRPKATRQWFPFQFSSGNELQTLYYFFSISVFVHREINPMSIKIILDQNQSIGMKNEANIPWK